MEEKDIELKVDNSWGRRGSQVEEQKRESEDKFEEGGDRANDYKIETEEYLHTGRAGSSENVHASLAGKPSKGFCKTYAKPICIIFTLILIAAAAACVIIFVMLKKDKDEEKLVRDNSDIFIQADNGKCPELFVYDADNDKCMQCPKSLKYGYIRDTKSCGTCEGKKVYDYKSRSCIDCPCGDDCENLVDQIWDNNHCITCPIWMKNDGKNECMDICNSDEFWNPDKKQCDKWYDNKCRSSGWNVFQEKIGGDNYQKFDDKCQHKCSALNIHMSVDKETTNEKHNPFFPRGVQCCDGADCGEFHGKNENAYNTITVGMEDACIYRVEIQEPVSNAVHATDINAVRYTWFHFNDFKTSTFGDFKEGESTKTHEFAGCLRGMKGWLKSDNEIKELEFNYQYNKVWRCGNEWERDCHCHGTVHYGLYVNPADWQVKLSFEEMKQMNPVHVVKKNVDGHVRCDPQVLGDPYPGSPKQCWCLHE